MSGASMASFMTGLHSIRDDSAGMVQVVVVHPSEGPELLAAALSGNQEAVHLFQAVVHALEGIVHAPKRKPMLCSSCPQPLRKATGFSLAVALPAKGKPSRGLCMAVCTRCADENDPAAVLAKATAALATIWPGARPVTVTHKNGGRA